jgi:transposase
MRYIKTLSPETQSLLTKFYRYSKKHETRQKAQCILLSNKGVTINELVLIFDVHLNTIYNWLNEWESRYLLSLYPVKGQGRKPLLSNEKSEVISQLVSQNPKQIKKVVSQISESFDIKLSTRTLKRYIKKTKIFMAKNS